MLLAAFIFAFLITKTVQEARTDRALADKGIVSPRLQAKYGEQARARTAGYGFGDYLRDAWSDNWRQRTEARRAAHVAADAAEPAPGRTKVRLRDRLRAAKQAAATVLEKAAPVVRKLVDPVPDRHRPAEPETTAPEPIFDPGPFGPACPECGRRLTAVDTEWHHPEGPNCPQTGRPYEFHRRPDPNPGPQHTNPKGARPMSAPTGEAVNYETTVAELEAIEREQIKHVDQAAACEEAIGAAKAAIDGMQESYTTTAAAAQGVNEHLAALNLDGETLAQVGTIGDAMPPNKVNEMYDHLELIEGEAKQQKLNAETALAATRAALGRVIAEYGDLHAGVAEKLGGDPSFVGSGAPTTVSA